MYFSRAKHAISINDPVQSDPRPPQVIDRVSMRTHVARKLQGWFPSKQYIWKILTIFLGVPIVSYENAVNQDPTTTTTTTTTAAAAAAAAAAATAAAAAGHKRIVGDIYSYCHWLLKCCPCILPKYMYQHV